MIKLKKQSKISQKKKSKKTKN